MSAAVLTDPGSVGRAVEPLPGSRPTYWFFNEVARLAANPGVSVCHSLPACLREVCKSLNDAGGRDRLLCCIADAAPAAHAHSRHGWLLLPACLVACCSKSCARGLTS